METKQQNNKTTTRQNSLELEASLAPAEADVGAEAKADQQFHEINGFLSLQLGLSFELGLRLRLTKIDFECKCKMLTKDEV